MQEHAILHQFVFMNMLIFALFAINSGGANKIASNGYQMMTNWCKIACSCI